MELDAIISFGFGIEFRCRLGSAACIRQCSCIITLAVIVDWVQAYTICQVWLIMRLWM